MFLRKKITCLGRSGILYRSGKMKLRLDSEFYSTPLGVILYKNNNKWHWEHPYEELTIDTAQRELILQEVIDYFYNKGYEVKIN